MIKPPKPENEDERLKTLYGLKILDTGREERFDRITRIASKLFEVPIALVSLIDANRQWLKSTQGIDVEETSRETSFCGHTILSNEIMVIEDATQDKRFFDNPYVIGDPNIKFYLGCPLSVKTHNVGTLCLIDSKPRQFKQTDLVVMRDLADMIQLELESLQSSTIDELTGLSNRRGFMEFANHSFKLCQREAKPFTLIYFDLDKFKYINDTFGHGEGDEVLQTFAKCLLKFFRGSDIIARLGGDEFCVFCTGLDEHHINTVLERLQKSLNPKTEKPYTIQYSVGCVHYDDMQHETLAELLENADKKMYGNKKDKRS